MTEPGELAVETAAGAFRILEWPGAEAAAVFLHGLTAVADVWRSTVVALGDGRPRCIAIDQRGHGSSPQGDIDYRVSALVQDVERVVDELGLGRVHLIGHSMGARVALVAAARSPERYHSVTVVDIGPEQWRDNWVSSVEGFSLMPLEFASEGEAIAFASQRRALSDEARALFLARLKPHGKGLVWRADVEALKTIVTVHRSRNYWAEWDRLGPTALLVRGGESNELRPKVAYEMRRRNTSVRFFEVSGAPHNIPLVAPEALAETLLEHWSLWQP
jgi:pimeloyl-ACP methyl ester carboxylesterase